MSFSTLTKSALLLSGVTIFATSCGNNPTTESKLAAIEPWEDCLTFNTANVTAKFVNNDWKVVDGNHWMFSFGSDQNSAVRTVQIIKAYGLSNTCFVARPNPGMQYQLTANQEAPRGELLAGEDCISFNNANAQAKLVNNSWKIVDGNMWMLDFGNNQAAAVTAQRVIQKYKFDRQCFVGRPGAKFSYWKVSAAAPARLPDLGAYGFLKIGKNQKLVRWNESIELTPADAFLISNGVPAFDLYYADKNYGAAPATGYRNTWTFGGTLVSQQPNRSLNAGAQLDIHTQAYLRPTAGRQLLQLTINADNNIPESSRSNNVFQVYVTFSGF